MGQGGCKPPCGEFIYISTPKTAILRCFRVENIHNCNNTCIFFRLRAYFFPVFPVFFDKTLSTHGGALPARILTVESVTCVSIFSKDFNIFSPSPTQKTFHNFSQLSANIYFKDIFSRSLNFTVLRFLDFQIFAGDIYSQVFHGHLILRISSLEGEKYI